MWRRVTSTSVSVKQANTGDSLYFTSSFPDSLLSECPVYNIVQTPERQIFQRHADEIATEMDISGDKVPRRPLAKLMFYLRAVSHCVDMEDLCDLRRWTDFPHYHLLTGQEADDVARLCFALSPDVLRLKCLKENDSNSGGFDTVFYDSDHAKTRWDHALSDSIKLRGSILRVTKVMECRTDWLQEFYYQPIKDYEHVMEGAKMTFRLETSSPRLARNSQTTYGTFCTASCV